MIEVFKQLVEALKISRDQNVDPEYAPIGWNVDRLDEAIQAGLKAIAELESQEPVAWRYALDASVEGPRWIYIDKDPHQWLLGPAMAMAVIEKLFNHPPQRTNEVVVLDDMTTTGEIKIKSTPDGDLHITATGKDIWTGDDCTIAVELTARGGRDNAKWHQVFSAALRTEQEPVAWKHDCAALLQNNVELWIDRCPHCGKPRTILPPQRKPLTDEQIAETFCKAPRQTQHVAWFAAGVRYAEAVHGIKEES